MTTALTTTNINTIDNYELAYSSDIMTALHDELGPDAEIPYERIVFPSGGALAFTVPGEIEDEPESAKTLEGVILFAHDINIYYDSPYSGKSEPPTCASLDGKTGIENATGVCKDCSCCPYNKFGSGKNGGKACKNKKRVYLLPSGSVLPMIVTIPSTSVKEYSKYIGSRIVTSGLRSYSVVTQISLKSAVSGSGFKYSKAVFKRLGAVPKEMMPALAQFNKDIKDSYQGYAITEADVVSGEAPAEAAEAPAEPTGADEDEGLVFTDTEVLA